MDDGIASMDSKYLYTKNKELTFNTIVSLRMSPRMMQFQCRILRLLRATALAMTFLLCHCERVLEWSNLLFLI